MFRFVLTRVLVVGLGVATLAGTLLAQATERVLYVSALDARTKAPIENLTAERRPRHRGRPRARGGARHVRPPRRCRWRFSWTTRRRRSAPSPTSATPSRRSSRNSTASARSRSSRPRIGRPSSRTTPPTRRSCRDAANRIFAQPDSGATLLDAIVEVSNGLGKREDDRVAIVLVTLELTEFSNLRLHAGARRAEVERRDDERGRAAEPGGLHPERSGPQSRRRARPRHRRDGRRPRGRAHQHELRRRPEAGGRRAEASAPRGLLAAADADSARADCGRAPSRTACR